MKITLQGPLAPDSAAGDFDVRQMKKALNRLGFYTPPYKDAGITGITDDKMFAAIRAYQASRGLRATGQVKPNDETMDALNADLADAPDGYYLWRTTGDANVRDAHQDYEGTVRAWSDAPDPGEDYNCRCWAEGIIVPDHLKETLDNVISKLFAFRKSDYKIAEKLLHHYLFGKGATLVLPETELDSSKTLQDALKLNNERFKNQILHFLEKNFTFLEEGKTIHLNDYWDVDIRKTNLVNLKDTDFYLAFGSVKIRSDGHFSIYKRDKFFIIKGNIIHTINDKYDFNDDRILDYLAFYNERQLASQGFAKPYDVHWKKFQNITGQLRIDSAEGIVFD